MDELQAGRIQLVALAGEPGGWADELLRALAALPKALRPAVVAPQAFDTLAFLDRSGPAAEGVRVLSRFVPAEQLGGDARAASPAPMPTCTGSRRRWRSMPPTPRAPCSRPRRRPRPSRVPRSRRRSLALPAHDGLIGRWAATPEGGITPRRLAVLVVDGGAFRGERVIAVAEPLPSSGEVK